MKLEIILLIPHHYRRFCYFQCVAKLFWAASLLLLSSSGEFWLAWRLDCWRSHFHLWLRRANRRHPDQVFLQHLHLINLLQDTVLTYTHTVTIFTQRSISHLSIFAFNHSCRLFHTTWVNFALNSELILRERDVASLGFVVSCWYLLAVVMRQVWFTASNCCID